MWLRFMAVLAVLVASVGVLAANASAAGSCVGHAATVVPVGNTYTLTAGDDVVVGTNGADEVTTSGGGTGGTDYVCTGNGDDAVHLDGVESATIKTGNGNDAVSVQNFDGPGTVDVSLGNGDDFIHTDRLGGTVRGGNGSDTLFFQGIDIIAGATVDGGSGDDHIQSASADYVYGGSGLDTVIDQSASGASLVDCGPHPDVFFAPNAATVRRCETPLF